MINKPQKIRIILKRVAVATIAI